VSSGFSSKNPVNPYGPPAVGQHSVTHRLLSANANQHKTEENSLDQVRSVTTFAAFGGMC
jgi:hypothetical protein